jgi:hypothetical protein
MKFVDVEIRLRSFALEGFPGEKTERNQERRTPDFACRKGTQGEKSAEKAAARTRAKKKNVQRKITKGNLQREDPENYTASTSTSKQANKQGNFRRYRQTERPI